MADFAHLPHAEGASLTRDSPPRWAVSDEREDIMTTKYAGGCAHVHVTASAEPIDNHECHCNVCKAVTG
jgi:hypothetical protein